LVIANIDAISILEFNRKARLAKAGSRSTAFTSHAQAVENHFPPRLRKAFVAPSRLHPGVQFEPPIINASLGLMGKTIIPRSEDSRRIILLC
jgi:hypothetical protein